MAPINRRRLLCLAGLAVALKVKKNKKKSRLWSKQFLLERDERADGNLTNELLLDPANLYSYLKMDQTAFIELLALVTPLIERADTSMRKAITPHERLYSTLLYLATGSSYMELQCLTRISTQSLGSIIPETCQAICKVLAKNYMKFPKEEEDWKLVAKEFEEKWQFPNCCGVVEGKHVRIAPPAGSGTHYINYRGFNSLVMMGIVNANCEFILFDVDSNAITAEAEIFEITKFGASLAKNEFSLPKEKIPAKSSTPLPYIFVGDETLTSQSKLLNQFVPDPQNYEQLVYNYRLSRVQSVGENAFGLMCDRFGIFHTNITISVKRVGQILSTCAILHNFLRRKCPLSYSPDSCFYTEDTVKCEISPGIVPDKNMVLDLRRDQSREGKGVDTKCSFMKYFCNEGALDWQCNMVVRNEMVDDHFLFTDRE